ncbi:MAG TPA: DUF3465 domain-containing protein [Candidatus Acidoferrales bacterium]|nr:DUF3465 domain-containing protein [Candidatus Acidoferrales bacterium]
MRYDAAAAALAVAFLLGGCGKATQESADDGAVCTAYRQGASHVEVIADGTVTRVLGIAPGHPSAEFGMTSPHEGFLMRLASGCDLIVRVEANTGFTNAFPLSGGESVTVKGEYEFYPRGGVIHWTHRDPRGRHAGGYVEAGGKFYD